MVAEEEGAVQASAVEEPSLPGNKVILASDEEIQIDLKAGRMAVVKTKLRSRLAANPTDGGATFAMANIMLYEGKRSTAIELLESIPLENVDVGLHSRGMAADLRLEARDYELAEDHYREILDRFPDTPQARRQLAWILNRQGRRLAAVPHLQALCRMGDIRQDELQALISIPDAIYTPVPPGGEGQNVDRLYFPIGPVAEARWHFAKFEFQESLRILDSYLAETTEVPPDVVAFHGRVLAGAQQFERLKSWAVDVDALVRDEAEYWVAMTALMIDEKVFSAAARCATEALLRDPTDYRTYHRMQQALVSIGEIELANTWWQRYVDVRRSITLSTEIGEQPIPDATTLEELIRVLQSLSRPMEAAMWQAIAVSRYIAPADESAGNRAMVTLNELRKSLNQDHSGFGSLEERLCRMPRDRFSLPTMDDLMPRNASFSGTASQDPQVRLPNNLPSTIDAQMTNIAAQANLTHTFHVNATPQSAGFAIYQQMGGGVAVTDMDLDGWPDLYFAQGGSALQPKMALSNQLYRQEGGNLHEVGKLAGVACMVYTFGVTSGDWNQDGFADLAYSTLQGTSLAINQGDGTYSNHDVAETASARQMCSSLAMGDMTGDGLPDLIQVCYVNDEDMLRRPMKDEAGNYEQLSPLNYQPAQDYVLLGSADGQPLRRDISAPAAAGLGILVGELDGQPGLEAFIANDVFPDQFLKFDIRGNAFDSALVRGCALGGRGNRTASMGITAADFNHDGDVDLHVTNFEDESVSLFVGNQGQFLERSVALGLDQPSDPFVGFGCQAIDIDNDGTEDLIVVNGRVERPTEDEHEFRQPTQILLNRNGVFELSEPTPEDHYLNAGHLGRGLARLDFDRDGRQDAVVTHVEEPSAILLNKTPTSNHWVNLRLVGTQSERDAIGAKVVLRVGSNFTTRWLLSGDGYLSKNQFELLIGLGSATRIDRAEITWPSGHYEVIDTTATAVDQSYVAVEGQSTLFQTGRQTQAHSGREGLRDRP